MKRISETCYDITYVVPEWRKIFAAFDVKDIEQLICRVIRSYINVRMQNVAGYRYGDLHVYDKMQELSYSNIMKTIVVNRYNKRYRNHIRIWVQNFICKLDRYFYNPKWVLSNVIGDSYRDEIPTSLFYNDINVSRIDVMDTPRIIMRFTKVYDK